MIPHGRRTACLSTGCPTHRQYVIRHSPSSRLASSSLHASTATPFTTRICTAHLWDYSLVVKAFTSLSLLYFSSRFLYVFFLSCLLHRFPSQTVLLHVNSRIECICCFFLIYCYCWDYIASCYSVAGHFLLSAHCLLFTIYGQLSTEWNAINTNTLYITRDRKSVV